MPDSTPDPELIQRARGIRLACFDVDGTLTDGRLAFDSDGRESKSFHVHDGQGLVLLRRAGIEVAFVTARASTIAERRAAELGLRCFTGVGDKAKCVRKLALELDISAPDIAFMGDDLPDLRVMREVGLSACPRDAHASVAAQVMWKSAFDGGDGAAREFCDLLLQAQGHAGDAMLALLSKSPEPAGLHA